MVRGLNATTPFHFDHTMRASKYATMIHSQGSLNFLTCFLGLDAWWLEFVVKPLRCCLLTLHTYWLVGINRPWSLRCFFWCNRFEKMEYPNLCSFWKSTTLHPYCMTPPGEQLVRIVSWNLRGTYFPSFLHFKDR